MPEPEEDPFFRSEMFFPNTESVQGDLNLNMDESIWKTYRDPDHNMPRCRICNRRFTRQEWFKVRTEQTIKCPGDGTTLIGQFDPYFECLHHVN